MFNKHLNALRASWNKEIVDKCDEILEKKQKKAIEVDNNGE